MNDVSEDTVIGSAIREIEKLGAKTIGSRKIYNILKFVAAIATIISCSVFIIDQISSHKSKDFLKLDIIQQVLASSPEKIEDLEQTLQSVSLQEMYLIAENDPKIPPKNRAELLSMLQNREVELNTRIKQIQVSSPRHRMISTKFKEYKGSSTSGLVSAVLAALGFLVTIGLLNYEKRQNELTADAVKALMQSKQVELLNDIKALKNDRDASKSLTQQLVNQMRLAKQMSGKLLADWPNPASSFIHPVRKRLVSALGADLFYSSMSEVNTDVIESLSIPAEEAITLVKNFIGNENPSKMSATIMDTNEIAREFLVRSDVATDYLCVISANPYTKFLHPRSDELSNENKENFFKEFRYFASFDREKNQRDRITRVFSTPCDPKSTDQHLTDSLVCSAMTTNQVHRFFCYLWINWSAGVDTKYHGYPRGEGLEYDFMEVADYVIANSPSAKDKLQRQCLYIAIPGNETSSYKFLGTPIFHNFFVQEFYNRLSISPENGSQGYSQDFMLRFRDNIFLEFRANTPESKLELKNLLREALDNLISVLTSTSPTPTGRIHRMNAEFERWFE